MHFAILHLRKSRPMNRLSATKLVCLALLIAGVWVAALVIIDHTIGIHSTPGFWAAALGFPGLMVAAWTTGTDSNIILYIIGFVVNFNVYFALIAGAVTVRRRFSQRSGVE